MAKAHVLDSNGGGQTRVAWHFTVPAGNNTAGISWVTALLNSSIPKTTVLPDGSGTGGSISAAEKATIGAATVFEVVTSLPIPAGLNTTQANAFLDLQHAAQQTEEYERLQRRLAYAGYTRV